ncbi:MAG: UDP-N-acetylglucosamine 1-carboxyvinyltransferase [bacterium]
MAEKAEKLVVNGGKEISGSVRLSGSKNNAAPVLAATLLSSSPFIIDNLPLIEDVFKTIKLLESMGAEVEWLNERKIKINTGGVNPETINLSLIGETRMSVLMIGPLLARFGHFKYSSPGGDKIGLRPIDTHIEAFKKLGAHIRKDGDLYLFDKGEMTAKEIILGEFSPTATENIMMTAALLPGKTTLKIAATEPHIQDLGVMLQKMGAGISDLGSHTIEIEGRAELSGVEHRIIPDYLEAGTFFLVGALTAKELRIDEFPYGDLDLFLAKMEEMGVDYERHDGYLVVRKSLNLKAVKIQALPHPGFPTDILPITVSLLTQAVGRSLIHDPLYENRLNFIHELRKMGADIELVDPHRAFVFGKTPLVGTKISSLDIRAGASLVVAALVAKGQTIIENIYQIDRGYEKIEEKLFALGADIKRVRG